MSEGPTTTAATLPRIIRPELDPWRFGWRYVKEPQPDGSVRTEQVPLTYEDVLYPQEGDVIVETPIHDQTGIDLKCALQITLAGRIGSVVLHDCRVDWGVEGVRPNCPDITVLENVGKWDPSLGTFRVADHAARPVLVIEVTSPSTRSQDLINKVVHYFRAGVPFYAIVDRAPDAEGGQLGLLGYRATPEGYVRTNLDEQGRLRLPLVGLRLGVERDELAILDEDGNRMKSYVQAVLRLENETQRADAEAERAKALEAKVRELEARLQSSGS